MRIFFKTRKYICYSNSNFVKLGLHIPLKKAKKKKHQVNQRDFKNFVGAKIIAE